MFKQECIPVGCVLSAAVVGGVYPSMHWAGGVCPGGVCHTPPLPVDRMTEACENYVVDGKKHNIPWDNRACSLVTKVQTYTMASNEIKQYNNKREFAD